MNRDPQWAVHPEGVEDAERKVRSELRAARIGTAMMIALMPAFGLPPRIRFRKIHEGSAANPTTA